MAVPTAPPARTGRRVRRVVLVFATGAAVGAVIAGLALPRVAAMGDVEALGTILYWAVAWTLGVLLLRPLVRVRPGWLRWLLTLTIVLPAFWLTADLFHALLLRRCYANWEAGIERDPATGVRVGCEERQYGNGATALLLVHGFADSPAIWTRMAPVLADQKGYTCYTLRLPYFAEPFDRYAASSAAGWRAHLAAELERLHRKHPRVVVVAHSLGGAVALDYLTDHPEAADGLVLLAPLIAVSNRRSPLLAAETWFHLLDHTLVFSDRVAMLLPPDVHDPQAAAEMKEDRFIPRTIYREMFGLIDRNRARPQQFSLPLLLVLSRTDQVVDSPTAERFFHDCGTPAAAKLLLWKDQAGHVLPIDTGWRELVEDIDRFVRWVPERHEIIPRMND